MATHTTSINSALPPRQGQRVSSQERSSRAQSLPSKASEVRTRRLYLGLIVLCLLGIGLTIFLRGWQRYLSWEQSHDLTSVLDAIAHRERQFFEANRAYTGARDELRLKLPPEVVARTELASGWYNGEPGYLAEFCLEGECELLTHSGQRLHPMVLTALTAHVDLPVLKEGPPRLLRPASAGHP